MAIRVREGSRSGSPGWVARGVARASLLPSSLLRSTQGRSVARDPPADNTQTHRQTDRQTRSPSRTPYPNAPRDQNTDIYIYIFTHIQADNGTFVISAKPFNNGNVSGACPQISHTDMAAAVKEQLALYPLPNPLYSQLIAEVYKASVRLPYFNEHTNLSAQARVPPPPLL